MCHPSPCTSRNHDGTLSGILPDDFDIHPSKTCVYTVTKTQDSYIFILKAWRVFAFQICLSKRSNLYPSLPKKNKKVWRFGLLCSTHTNRALEILTPRKTPYKSHQNPQSVDHLKVNPKDLGCASPLFLHLFAPWTWRQKKALSKVLERVCQKSLRNILNMDFQDLLTWITWI